MKWSVLKRSIARRGLGGTLASLPLWSLDRIRYGRLSRLVRENTPAFRKRRMLEKQFDHEFGVETTDYVEVDQFVTSSPNRQFASRYRGIEVDLFAAALRELTSSANLYTFIDLGSGKGRACLLAAGYPFRRVIGVEFDPVLHEIALRNLASFRAGTGACCPIDLFCMDACDFSFPEEPLIVFLFNPFGGEVLSRVLNGFLEATRGRRPESYLVYVNPVHEALVDAMPGFHAHGSEVFAGVKYRIWRVDGAPSS